MNRVLSELPKEISFCAQLVFLINCRFLKSPSLKHLSLFRSSQVITLFQQLLPSTSALILTTDTLR